MAGQMNTGQVAKRGAPTARNAAPLACQHTPGGHGCVWRRGQRVVGQWLLLLVLTLGLHAASAAHLPARVQAAVSVAPGAAAWEAASANRRLTST